jgi:hypothetical protein
MAKRLTLHTLAENLIRESRNPFTVDEFVDRIQKRWRRKIAPSTLDTLREKLSNHDYLIGLNHKNFIPYQAVLDRIGHIPMLVQLGKFETDQGVFIPGHRLMPFLSVELSESDITFLGPAGQKIPKEGKSFFIEEVLHLYQYSDQRHFPDQIRVNQWAPGKSKLKLRVWELATLRKELDWRPGDGLKIFLQDFDAGVFSLETYPAGEMRRDRLRLRSLNIRLENALKDLSRKPGFQSSNLEKQLLHIFFAMEDPDDCLPGFSLTALVESLEKLTLVRGDGTGVQLIPADGPENGPGVWEAAPHSPQGRTGSLQSIFEDMGLAITENEFKAILYSVMATEDFNIESVFALLFGAKQDAFYNKRQHSAFYRLLRKLLNQIMDELKGPEPQLVSRIRNQAVAMKLRLIEILRFLEFQEVGLEDLPEEVLDQLAELDGFCMDALHKLSDRPNPPDVKTIRDLRVALQMVQPNMDHLEEDVFYRLGIY